MKNFWYLILLLAGILIAVYSVFYDPMAEPVYEKANVEGHDIIRSTGWQPPEDWDGLVEGGIDVN